jgi:guanylate kinase
MSNRQGRLFILSAPSGAGKTTVARRVADTTIGVGLSRSYTSRPARAGEQDGVDYNFISAERFSELRKRGAFLEWAEVFGDFYGTGASETDRRLAAGEDLLLVIDVQGARKVRAAGVESVGIFLMPPSFSVLEQRLRGRGRDPESAILRRLATARDEVQAFAEYDYLVVNDDAAACADRVRAIVLAERSRSIVMRECALEVASTFTLPPSDLPRGGREA